MIREDKNRGKSENGDVSLPLTIGVAFANFAEAVERHGGDPSHIREGSLDALETALKDRSELWRARVMEGEQLEKLGRFDEAVDAYRKALARTRWDSTLKTKLFRAMVASTIREANRKDVDPGNLRPSDTVSIREKATKIVTRRPKSARIRKLYEIGRIRSGA
ncbi:MAG: tetratricopeptide repeat protein [Planctomycetota bacterium]|jgi:tetratricopeptide (TPR) repeat protein